MKKLFDSKFLIISALSIVTLILLVVFSFFLFDRDEAKFAKSGYIINPLSATSEKYFFNEGTGYRENLSSMVVFNSVDDKEVKVLRDSFVHYEDGSISLLKNGAILDVDSIHDNLALFYNITNDSIIEKNMDRYSIESLSGNVDLKNFIVRISDNKYLVAGNVKLSYSGSPSLIDGDYFEIVYSEEGIVNIENKSFKYELSAEGTQLIVGDYTIDLGTKVLSYKDKDVMSITAITIDGNENVEIIPKKEEPKPSSSNNPVGGTSESGAASGNVSPGSSSSPSQSGNGSDGSGGSEGSGGTERINNPKVSLKDAKVNSTSVEVIFDIDKPEEDDNHYMLQVINADTGNTIDITAEVLADTKIEVDLLTPSTKYLFTVVDKDSGQQYFQKMFKTDSFGIKLEKTYAKSDSLSYRLTVGEDTQVSDAVLTLYKFDEELGYRVETGKSIRLSNVAEINTAGEYNLTFDGLESDTIYIAELGDFSLESINFRDVYNITVTSLTLKKTPIFPNESSGLMSITEGENADNFKLYIGDIDDSDNAIISYTYYVYDTNETVNEDDDELALAPVKKDNASPITVNLGRRENELKEDTNYYYKAVIEYYDNEKYIEYETINSSYFIKTGKPTVTIIPDSSRITHNQIGAKIYINDKGCEIKLAERPGVNCAGDNIVRVRITKLNSSYGISPDEETREIVIDRFNFAGDTVSYDLTVPDLETGTTYVVGVYTYDDEGGLVKIPPASDSTNSITTLTLADFQVRWGTPDSSKEHVINIGSQLEGRDREDALSISDSVSKISKVVIGLYDGDVRNTISLVEPIKTKLISGNIKELFYDNEYLILSDETFGLTKADLENLNSDHKVSRQYTISINAYYGTSNEITLIDKTFLYNVPITVIEDNISKPEIFVDTIKNSQTGNFFDKVSEAVPVGYDVHALFVNDERIVVKNAIFKVYDVNNNPVKFYVKKNGNIDLEHPVNEIKYTDIDSIEADFEIYMDYGIDYNSSSDVMRRGNQYTVGYYLEVLERETGNVVKYPSVEEGNWPSSHGVYAIVKPSKVTPTMIMYPSISTVDSIKYKYFIKDPDNSLYKGEDNNYYLYYKLNDSVSTVELEDGTGAYKFAGDFTIAGLSEVDTYSFYYKLDTLKTGNIDTDVQMLNDSKLKDFKFDKYVEVLDDGLKYQIKNEPLSNRVVIGILSNNEVFNNTLDYKITLNDSKGHNYEIVTSQLSDCGSSFDVSGNRCYYVDYGTLKAKNMKSTTNDINNITVTVRAAYDTGLLGYDMTVSGENEYVIFREMSRLNKNPNYIALDLNGHNVAWVRGGTVLAGYYSYKKHLNEDIITSIDLKNDATNVETNNIGLTPNAYGYTMDAAVDAVSPHKVIVEDLSLEGNNSFYFTSIIPKAAPVDNSIVPLLSGAGIDLKLSGIDLADFDPNDHNLYIEIWNNSEDALNDENYSKVARPRITIPIDANTGNVISGIEITELPPSMSNYYYRIYAPMKVNSDILYVPLSDANSEGTVQKVYSFQTLRVYSILLKDDLKLNVDESGDRVYANYGERTFTTEFDLKPYSKNYAMDYTLDYYLCDGGREVRCDLDHPENFIIRRQISKDDMSESIKETFNVYDYTFWCDSNNENCSELVYGKNYKMRAYAKLSVYRRNDHDELEHFNEYILLTKDSNAGYEHYIRPLEAPTFTILREATYVNGEYVIDLSVNVNDPDAVLKKADNSNYGVNGVYYLSMTKNNELVGTLQDFNNDEYIPLNIAGYEDYSKYPFDASNINKMVRVVLGSSNDLANKEHQVQVCGDVYINNASVDNPNYQICSRKYSAYTSNEHGVAFGAISYTPTLTSMYATFFGGSSLVNNIDRLSLTILDKTDNRYVVGDASEAANYVIGDSEEHRFEYNKQASEEWTLILQRNMNNQIGHGYVFTMVLYDKDDNVYVIPTSDPMFISDENANN